jgi:hypothetical protein
MLLKIKNLACARTGGSDDGLALEKKNSSRAGRATWRRTAAGPLSAGAPPGASPSGKPPGPDRVPCEVPTARRAGTALSATRFPPLLILHLHPSPPSPSRALGGTDGGGRPSCLSGRGRWARRARRCRVGRPSGQVGHALPAPGGALTRACGPGVLVVLVLVVLRRPSLSIKRRGGTKNICAL